MMKLSILSKFMEIFQFHCVEGMYSHLLQFSQHLLFVSNFMPWRSMEDLAQLASPRAIRQRGRQ